MQALNNGFLQSALMPVVLFSVVVGSDGAQTVFPFHLLRNGALDEPAHLATAALVLTAVADWPTLRRHRTVARSALIASVAIDLDHIPAYAGVRHLAADGRPYSHSLSTVAVLTAASWKATRQRRVLAGAALGVALHLLRDAGTGPGLPLWWPVSRSNVRVPYPAYLSCLVGCAGLATVRALRQRAPLLGQGAHSSLLS